MAKTTTWFEVRYQGMNTTHATLERAKKEIRRQHDGCPDNKKMTAEDRAYWKKVAAETKIIKVEQKETEVKFSL